MEAKKLAATAEELSDPASRLWSRIKADVIPLEGTPVQLQPSRYARAKWSDRPTGTVRALAVRVAHNGRQIFFRLDWRDDAANRDHDDRGFPDAAGILFPVNGDAPLQSMGSPDAPVNAWYWRADDDGLQNLAATGLGTITQVDGARLLGRSRWDKGSWRVVMGRSLRAARSEPSASLSGRRPLKVAFAVWEGSQGERGGIKSFSNGWQSLTLQP